MEENIKIKLNIGDRVYPLTVQRSQEFYFREAAKIIEKTIKNLEQNYVSHLTEVACNCSDQSERQKEKERNKERQK